MDEDNLDEGVLLADGFGKAFIGVGHRSGCLDVAVYDYDRCARVLMRRDKMSLEDAYEFMDFNVVGSWVGDRTPIFLERRKLKEIAEHGY
jgi:hypothetical protein